ncbi:hypothetical protein [Actinomadura macrotermitis]|uniref:hypothetical protein n=1 Tax=Actinomadura macrotermitis TaxID=2585200 RepID=UPI00129555A1|nr:hypothetical protein [Actinomadura macrotermitis]
MDLLIGHEAWLAREDFVCRYVEVETDSFHAGGRLVAFVRWRVAAGAVKAGRLAYMGSEAAMLRIAAGIAAAITVDRREALGGLDASSLGLVLKALARDNGRSAEVVVR